jgi:catechol 2,3-dioxygenase
VATKPAGHRRPPAGVGLVRSRSLSSGEEELEMQVQELGHLVLYVRDVDRSARFYRDVLGWRQIGGRGVTSQRSPVAAFAAPGGRTHHELLLIEVGADAAALPEGKRVGLYHFGLKVGDSDDQLREALAAVTAAGATVLGSSDHTVTHSLYIADPDGNEIELYIDVPGVDWRNDPSLLMTATRPLSL